MILYEKQLPGGKFATIKDSPADFPFGVPLMVRQVHSADLVKTTDIRPGPEELPIADGIICLNDTFSAGAALASPSGPPLPLQITTADCLPVVLLGRKGYCHLHAGWRGLAKGILAHPLISKLEPYYSFIGPSIRPCCYEVGAEFGEHFPGSKRLSTKLGKSFFDLPGEASDVLSSQYPRIKVEDSGLCTCCVERFYSFRRDGTKGRNKNIFHAVGI